MTVEKKMIRSDIPGSHVFLNGSTGYAGSPAEDMRRLVVPRDISLNGNINDCGCLVIEGAVEAQAFNGRRMDILDGGLFKGAAEVQDCVIAGRFEGNLTVLGRLTVKPTGYVCGEVQYNVLEVEGGGKLEARLVPAPAIVPAALEEALASLAPLDPPPPANVEPLFTAEESTQTGRSVYRRASRG